MLFIVPACAAGAIVLALPFNPYVTGIVMQAATHTVAVVGLTVVLGYAGQITLAQAAFFGIGAYCLALGILDLGLHFWVALSFAGSAAGCAGWASGLASGASSSSCGWSCSGCTTGATAAVSDGTAAGAQPPAAASNRIMSAKRDDIGVQFQMWRRMPTKV